MTSDDRTMAGIEMRAVLSQRYPDWARDMSTSDLMGIMLVMDAIVDLADGSKTSAEAWAAVHKVAACRTRVLS